MEHAEDWEGLAGLEGRQDTGGTGPAVDGEGPQEVRAG